LAEKGVVVLEQIEYLNLKETCQENGLAYPPLRKCRGEDCPLLTRNLTNTCGDCTTTWLLAKRLAAEENQTPIHKKEQN
jgi:hypothetical protein